MAFLSVLGGAAVRSKPSTKSASGKAVGRPVRRRAFNRFGADDRGAVTVEYVLWLPFFLLLLVTITDISVHFYSHSRMWDVARDASRRVATGQMTAADAKAYAEGKLPGMGTYEVSVDNSGANDVIVTITGQGIFVNVMQIQGLVTEYTMRKEGAA